MREFGIPSVECQEYEMSDGISCKMNLNTSAFAAATDTDQACGPQRSLYAVSSLLPIVIVDGTPPRFTQRNTI